MKESLKLVRITVKLVSDNHFKRPKFANKIIFLMKKIILALIVTFMASCSVNSQVKLYLTANGVTKTATLVENEATAELISLLEKEPISLTMTENGGFEKVGDLPHSLPTSDMRQTAQSGDIMLYIGNVICIFYGSNTWAYTKLGTMDNMTSSEIKEFLSGNPVSVSLSLEDNADVKQVKISGDKEEKVYDLKGNLISKRPLLSGVYIINGKKTLVR